MAIDAACGPAVVSLGFTKGGQHQGAAESVTLTVEQVLRWLFHWKQTAKPGESLCEKPAKWRKQFNDTLTAVGFQACDFRPYSLRRGGATYWFKGWGQLDRLLVYGRWQNARAARTYINDGLAVLTSLNLPSTPSNRRFRLIYTNSCHEPLPSLEPAVSSRTGAVEVERANLQNRSGELKKSRLRSEGEVSLFNESYEALESSGFGGATKGNSNQSSRLDSCSVWRRLLRGTLEV